MRSLYRQKRFLKDSVLTGSGSVLTLADLFWPPFCRPFRSLFDHATYVSTEQSAPRAYSWLSRAHGHSQWPQGAGPPPFQGPSQAHSVNAVPPARSGLGSAGEWTRPLSSGREPTGRLTFPAQRRLRRKPEFEEVYARGRRMGNGFFAVTARVNQAGHPRLGMAVASRLAGGSVERNRIRRVVRESFRLNQLDLPAVDIVVGARPRAKGATNAELRVAIEELWGKVRQQCASLPAS